MAVLTPYVEYIKISRTDKLGQDLTPTLEALTQIRIPFTNGVSTTYLIASTTRYNDYFLFGIKRASNSPLQSDAGTIDYAFSASLSDQVFSGTNLPGQGVSNPVPITSPSTNLFNIDNTKISINTYIQKEVTFTVNFTASITGGPAEAKILQNGIGTSTSVALSVGTSNNTLSFTVDSSSLSPSTYFELDLQAPSPSGPYSYTYQLQGNSSWVISSTAESGPTISTIPEPYLISKFEGTDCDVLLNNEESYRENPFLQDIDYSLNPFVPVNFDLIASGSAIKGTVPLSNYTSKKSANPRYNGCKNQSKDYNFYPPNGNSFSLDTNLLIDSPVDGIVNNNRISNITSSSEPAVVTGTGTGVFGGFTINSLNSDYFKVIDGSNFPSWGTGTMTRQKMLEVNSAQLNALTKDYSNIAIYFDINTTVSVTDGDAANPGTKLSLSLFTIQSGSSNTVIPRAGEITSTNGADSWYTATARSEVITNNTLNQKVRAVGNIPISAVNNARKYLALSLTSQYTGTDATSFSFSDTTAKITIQGIPLNIGTYGQTSPIDILDTNIYEFDWGGGTTPEILDWGAVKMGKILQVSSKDLVKTVNPSQNVETIVIPSKRGTTSGRARNYRAIVGNSGDTQYPPGSVNTSSVGDVHFWDTPQNVGDYYQILNGNNPLNHEISMFMYPNSSAGSDPTIPSTTKILTTEWGVPSKSNYALTSSNAVEYGSINSGTNPRRFITLDRGVHISKVTTDTNGFYASGQIIKPNWATIGDQINHDLNEGEKWFVTLYNEFEFPNNAGDYNSVLTTGSLSPFNDGVTLNEDGNYSNALAYKGVYEIAGVYDNFSSDFNILTYDDFPDFGGIKKIGGGTPGNSLGMLIWKARAAGKNEFVLVQDSVTGGVSAGAFTSKYVPDYISENFEEITKTYGANQTG